MSDDAKFFMFLLLGWILIQGCSLERQLNRLDSKMDRIESRVKQ